MNRYTETFRSLRKKNECAFIPFAVAGDPTIKTSETVFATFIDSGADILEIGYPFSDPIADGPVNQRAATRAIAAGLNHDSFFKLIGRLRKRTEIPFGLLCYANTVLHYGIDRFCKRAAESGIDSILVADMPPEESGEMLTSFRAADLATVFIVSELTPPDRLRYICNQVTGFVYVVSRLGPTGAAIKLDMSVAETLTRLRNTTEMPLCVGFGLSSPAHIRAVKKAGADGAIVGSHLVSLIEKSGGNKPQLLGKLANKVKAFKRATR